MNFFVELAVVGFVLGVSASLIAVRVGMEGEGGEGLGTLISVYFAGYNLTLWNYDFTTGIAAFTMAHYLLAYLVVPIPFEEPGVFDDFMVVFLLVVLAGVVLGVVQIWAGFAPRMFSKKYFWSLCTKEKNATIYVTDRTICKMDKLQMWFYVKKTLSITTILILYIGARDYLPGLIREERIIVSLIVLPVLYYVFGYKWLTFPIKRKCPVILKTSTGMCSVTGEVSDKDAFEVMWQVLPVHFLLTATLLIAQQFNEPLNTDVRLQALLIGVFSAVASVAMVFLRFIFY